MGDIGLGRLVETSESEKLRKEYLRRIDAEAVFDHYGGDAFHRRGDEIIHSCLIDRVDPHHANGDANPSASINVAKKLYHCHTYGGGDIFWFITLMEGKSSFREIIPVLSDFLTESTVDSATFLEEIEKYFDSSNAYSKESLPRYHERILRQWDYFHPYLKGRGISFEAAKRLRLGYDEKAVRITFPHWVDGHLVGWQKRKLTDPRWPQTPPEILKDGRTLDPPKYKNSPGFPKDSTVYNLDRVIERGVRHIVVCESPASVAKAETWWEEGNLDDPFGGFVSTFGSSVNEEQIRALRGFDSVTVWCDADFAGRKSAYLLMDGLWRFTDVLHVEPESDPDKDPGDYEIRSDAERILNTREPAVLALPGLEERYGRRKGRRSA